MAISLVVQKVTVIKCWAEYVCFLAAWPWVALKLPSVCSLVTFQRCMPVGCPIFFYFKD